MRIAAVNFKVASIGQVDDFFNHLDSLITTAAKQLANIIVLPEYTIAELYSLIPKYAEAEAPKTLVPFAKQYIATLQELSDKHNLVIIGGTFFQEKSNRIYNVCPIIHPFKLPQFQVKNRLTVYEKEVQKIAAKDEIIQLYDSKIGVLICYDSEFPEFARTLCEHNVLVLCVPSYTETIYGFNRIRYSCLARAIENQVFVVHSALVGGLNKEPLPTSIGSSAIIAPCAAEFSEGPILAETEQNKEDIAYATLDFEKLISCRTSGEVRNWDDRPKYKI